MDPFFIFKSLQVTTLIIVGMALYVFWRTSDRTPFLLHWSLYEFTLAVAVLVDAYMLPVSVAMGVAVSVLLLGILGYRKQRQPPLYAFILLVLAIALPAYVLGETFSKTYGYLYLAIAVSTAYLAAAILFFKEGGAINGIIAVVFLARIANSMLYAVWESMEIVYMYYAAG